MNATQTALQALQTPNKRARVHDAQMVTKLPKAVKDLVNDYAETSGDSEAGVVRLALAEFFERRGYGK